MCRVGWDDGPEFYSEERPRARKAHRCDECGRTINPGERYFRANGKWDGFFTSNVMCAHCDAASQWLIRACSGFIFGEICEELVEHWNDEPELRSLTLARLIAGLRHQWFQGRSEVPDPAAVRASVPAKAAA